MWMTDLFEDANDDLWATALADRYYTSLISYLYKLKGTDHKFEEAYVYVDGRARKLSCITSDDFDFPIILKKMVLAFIPSHYEAYGKAIGYPYHPDNTHDQVLLMSIPISNTSDDLPNTVTVEEVLRALHNDRHKDVLFHEIQHILDYRRYKGDLFGSRGTKPSDPPRAKDGPRYYNDSLELNAYFHNFAEPLLKRIRFIQTKDVDAAIYDMLFPEMSRDFNTFLEDRTKHLYGPIGRFWKQLDQRNRRRVISRLKNLFDLYWQYVATLPEVDMDDKYPSNSVEGSNVQSS